MGHDNRPTVPGILSFEPLCDPVHKAQKRIATMRRRRRITQPSGNAVGVSGRHLIERGSAPISVIAFAQHRWRNSFELERFRRLPGPQLRAYPKPVGSGHLVGESRRARPTMTVKRLVCGKGRLAHGVGGRVTDQNEARCHQWRNPAYPFRLSYACNLPLAKVRWVKAPNSKPSVAHMMNCAPREAILNFHSTTAGNSSGTSLTAGSRSEAIATTAI